MEKIVTQNILTTNDVKEKLPSLIKNVEENFDRYIITVKGHPKAVLLSYEEFENLQEELEILAQNPNFFNDREQAHQDLTAGKTASLDMLNKELGL